MYSELLNHLITIDDTTRLREEIVALQPSVYVIKDNAFEQALQTSVRAWVADLIRKDLQQKPGDVEEYLHGLIKAIDALPIIQIVLAFEPSEHAAKKIAEWFGEQNSEKMLLDIQYQPSIIGGVVIIKNGQYHDFSLQKKMKDALEAEVRRTFFTTPVKTMSGQYLNNVQTWIPKKENRRDLPL